MSDLLKHVLVGDLIGSLAANSKDPKKNNLATVFMLGVISHAVMDISEPDYTINWFNRAELISALPFLTLQVGGIGLVMENTVRESRSCPRTLMLRMAGILGAVIPDFIDGIYSILNPHAWYSGQLLCPWHIRTWQVNLMSMWGTSILTGALALFRYKGADFFRSLGKRFAT